jgi:hypothetical protein
MVKQKTGRVTPEERVQHKGVNVMEKDRKCRDVIFLILFFIFWGGMAIVATNAMRNGDPARLM